MTCPSQSAYNAHGKECGLVLVGRRSDKNQPTLFTMHIKASNLFLPVA
ncbi:hypothetical protein Krac_8155 [Ktedonobacter racemifer DSM 44963]|uniref:Uncharacterized protein n=1 Tax=Ktedonobacter racemifer DSM 44963 TaxID=485913 RepID=D6TM39_KTERA|nr:hypothetical protein Krac_8155 [Ktedonobacter racemifer DSM 44963]